MTRIRFLRLLLAASCLNSLSAQEKPAIATPYTPPSDMKGTWGVQPDPGLPNVLILGDSISIGYTLPVRRLLAGKANVYRPMRKDGKGPDNCGDTTMGMANIDKWLGDKKWDVIHFNWGLWDLCYRHPESKEQGKRDKVRGRLSTKPEDYEKNLETLVARLEKTGAKLIWAHTTVVPEGEVGRFVGDELKYNEIARRVMERHRIPINDLNTPSRSFPPDHFIGPGDVHFTGTANAKLAAQVAAEIGKHLSRKQKSVGYSGNFKQRIRRIFKRFLASQPQNPRRAGVWNP